MYQYLYTAREELFDSCRFHALPHFPYEGTWLHQPIPGQTNRDGITQREPPDSAALHPGYLFDSVSAGLGWARFALPNLQNPETVIIPPGRAEKRLHRAFRRMSNIRRITPAKRRRLIRPTQTGWLPSSRPPRPSSRHGVSRDPVRAHKPNRNQMPPLVSVRLRRDPRCRGSRGTQADAPACHFTLIAKRVPPKNTVCERYRQHVFCSG